jgi:hypothetical protein
MLENNFFNKNDDNAGSTSLEDANTPAQLEQNNDSNKKFSKFNAKRFVLIVLLLFLIGATTAYYFKYIDPKEVSNSQGAEYNLLEANFDKMLVYQMGTKVIAYDPVDSQSHTITNQIPAGTDVIEFYGDDTTWRLFLVKNQSVDKGYNSELLYLEKGQPIKSLYSPQNNDYLFAVASAKAKKVAYVKNTYEQSAAKNYEHNKILIKSETYMINDKQETNLVYVNQAADAPAVVGSETDKYKSTNYLLSDISLDGNKLLFRKHSCVLCNAPPLASGFEYSLSDKSIRDIMKDEKTGRIGYASDGHSIQVYQNTADSDGPDEDENLIEKYLIVDSDDKSKLIANINQDKWISTILDPTSRLLYYDLRAKNFSQNNERLFGGFYLLNDGTEISKWTKLDIDKPSKEKFEIESISAPINNCHGLILSPRNKVENFVAHAGVICYDDKGTSVNTPSIKVIDTANLQEHSTHFRVL